MIRVACWEDERRAKQQNVAPTLPELRSTPSLVPRAVGIAKVGLGRNPCLLSSLAPKALQSGVGECFARTLRRAGPEDTSATRSRYFDVVAALQTSAGKS